MLDSSPGTGEITMYKEHSVSEDITVQEDVERETTVQYDVITKVVVSSVRESRINAVKGPKESQILSARGGRTSRRR